MAPGTASQHHWMKSSPAVDTRRFAGAFGGWGAGGVVGGAADGFEYYRHGTRSLIAALDTQTGEVRGKHCPGSAESPSSPS